MFNLGSCYKLCLGVFYLTMPINDYHCNLYQFRVQVRLKSEWCQVRKENQALGNMRKRQEKHLVQ